ncbi:hypothetical protein DFA_10398 [Cavenderia fasciculata]|uniref:Uncharacterized protein n=1 Tax=Cavenderia fasciculata TaxID=261658 RepID=F4QA37_CACFS|nr:uncharacterized protein DFA_10398 [Cavenderia fasciculata]EGG15556.1 hypothetical protein DFA_10398 [Cavenderia fasciculata]|eukprot:XP_004354298.1 hypothetical protein DFA_10398 [Cavenderia fasciculata]
MNNIIDVLGQVIEQSLKSDHHYVFTIAECLILQPKQELILDTRLAPSIIGFLHQPDLNQDKLDLVIRYFNKVELSANKENGVTVSLNCCWNQNFAT